MNGIFELVLDLLGKTPGHPLFDELAHKLADAPMVNSDDEISTEFQFLNSGLELSFNKQTNCFAYAKFHFRKPKVTSLRNRWKAKYRGNLPGGIELDDDLVAARQKLTFTSSSGFKPLAADILGDLYESIAPGQHDIEEVYEMTSVTLNWTFNAQDKKLSMLSLSYKPASEWINKQNCHPKFAAKNVPRKND